MHAHRLPVLPAPNPLDAVLPRPHFSERHSRLVAAPAGDVWAAVTTVTPAEIRVLGPLMALRSLPQLVRDGRRRATPDSADVPFLDVFKREGFAELRHDPHVADGRATVIYGGAGKFWSLSDNASVPISDPEAFEQHRAPGTVKVAFSLEVTDHGGRTSLATETRIVGTDASARRAFGRYWLIIRGPSGLIRRSWLAAIDRRARA